MQARPSPAVPLLILGAVLTFTACGGGDGAVPDVAAELDTGGMDVTLDGGDGAFDGDTSDGGPEPDDGKDMMTPDDTGTGDTDDGANENRAPTAPEVTIEPVAPTTLDGLRAKVTVGAIDADGDPLTYRYRWSRDGAPTTFAEGEVPAGAGVRGQVWQVAVSAFDGALEGPPAVAEVTIVNAAPAGGVVVIEPDVLREGVTARCAASGAEDPDGDPIDWLFVWWVDDVMVGVTADTLGDEHFDRGQRVACGATPTDGETVGPMIASEEVRVANSAPALERATLEPPELPRDGVLTCTWLGWSDPDPADEVGQVAYTWWRTREGEEVQLAGAAGATLVPSMLNPGDLVVCEVTPLNPGLTPDRGPSVRSPPSLVLNRLPVLNAVDLAPTEPRADSVLDCTPVGADDPDRDPLDFTYRWTRNGVALDVASNTLGNAFAKGDTVSCEVTPRDPFGAGPPVVSPTVTILNATPAGGYANLRPTTGVREGTTLTCVGTGATDLDGDPITWRYGWRVDGLPVAVTTATLTSAHFDRGQSVTCTATPFDGEAEGAPASSAPVTVDNSPPSLAFATLGPAEVPRAGTLSCAFTGWSDPDPADADPNVAYAWFVAAGGAGAPVLIPGQTAATFTPTALQPGDRVTCAITPMNPGLTPDRGTPVHSNTSLVVNRAPTLASVALAPPSPRVDSVLSCTPGSAIDPDGDPVSFTYRWLRGQAPGAPIANATSATLSATFAKGDVLRCEVTPRDPFGPGAPITSNAVTIQNAPPTGGLANLSPTTGVREGTTLACVGTGATDLDGDPITWRYGWRVDGLPVAVTTATLTSAHFDRGQSVTCTATPFDGEAEGATASSAPVTVDNSPPSLTFATLGPAEVPRAGALSCAFTGWSDPDPADADPNVAYAWFVATGGAGAPVLIPGQTASTFTPTALQPGDRVTCAITPMNPGLTPDRGTPVHSNTSLVVNRAPTLASVALAPPSPRVDSVLSCTPGSAIDPDGDPVSFTYRWLRGQAPGAPIANATSATLSATFAKGDVLRCEATPRDPFGPGTPITSNAVTILNTPPTLTSVALTPSPATPCATFICAAGAIADPDAGDTHGVTFRWTVDDLPVAHTGASWSPSDLTPGRRVRCHATASDGIDPSPEQPSNEVTTTNTPPTLASVSVLPSPTAQAGSTVTCAPSGYSDPECAPTPSYTWRWFRNGAPLAATTATLSTAGFAVGDAVSCEATPRDQWTSGTPRASNAVTLTNTPPTVPVVLVGAPSGAAGPITCELVVPSVDTQALTYTWYWQIGANPSFVAPQRLDRPVTDCDRVRCWASVSDGYATVTSGASQLVLPFGPACSDGNVCTDDACAPGGGCQYTNHTRSCADADLCNGTETCLDGTCRAGAPVACGGVTNPCLQTVCNPATGACDLARDNGWPCPDADLCNGRETCLAGVCRPGAPVECGAVTAPCLQQACNPATGACDLPRADGTTCNDGDACTWNDACEAGACVAEPVCGCDLTAGLLLRYDFESSLQDRSGNGRHATAAKAATYANSPVGRGLVFDGTQILTIQDGKVLGPTTTRSRTITFWARPSAYGSAIMNQYQDQNSGNSSFFIAPNGAPSWQITGNGTNVLHSGIAPLETWEHIAVVFAAGANQTVIYRNGVEVTRGALNYAAAQSTRDTKVGEGLGLLGNYRGALDELRVYDRALSAADIARLAATTCDPISTPASCKAIELATPSAPSGPYTIDVDGAGPLPEVSAWCDLTTDGGGWTRVFGHRISEWTNTVPPSYGMTEGLGAARTESGYVAPAQLSALMSQLGATEVRMTCAKTAHTRVIDIKTSNGPAVAWLTGQSNTLPLAAGSFTRLPGDSATLSQQPSQWGYDGQNFRVGKWGHSGALPANRLVDHPMFVETSYHWLLTTNRSECDDWVNTQGDPRGYWHIYVR